MPMTKLPLMMKLPKASMTWPAASVPVWPSARIRRVDARLSASRIMVAMSSTVGNDENSSGVWMKSAVIRMRTEKTIETASSTSSSIGGSGRIRTMMIAMTPIGEADVGRAEEAVQRPEGGDAERAGRRDGAGDVSHALGDRPLFARGRHEHAFVGVLVELVAQRADRDAEDVGGVGAVAEHVVEGIEDQVALDVGDGAADEAAGRGAGGLRGLRSAIERPAISPRPVPSGMAMASGPMMSPEREQHGAVERVLELADVAGPGRAEELLLGLGARDCGGGRPLALAYFVDEVLAERGDVAAGARAAAAASG